MQFLGRPGDGGGRDREVPGQVGGAALELRAPFAVGGTGDSESQLESLGFFAGLLLGRGLLRLLLGRSSSLGRVGRRRTSRQSALDRRNQDVGSVGVGGRCFCCQSVDSHS
jgi:hypothetical protein